MESGIGPMADAIFNQLISQMDNPKLKDYFNQKWINPLQEELKKYQTIAVGAYFLIVMLLFVIIYLVLRK